MPTFVRLSDGISTLEMQFDESFSIRDRDGPVARLAMRAA